MIKRPPAVSTSLWSTDWARVRNRPSARSRPVSSGNECADIAPAAWRQPCFDGLFNQFRRTYPISEIHSELLMNARFKLMSRLQVLSVLVTALEDRCAILAVDRGATMHLLVKLEQFCKRNAAFQGCLCTKQWRNWPLVRKDLWHVQQRCGRSPWCCEQCSL